MKKLKHKNYVGEYEYSAVDDTFCGKLIGINDLVLFEGRTDEDIQKDFILAVEDYIQTKENL